MKIFLCCLVICVFSGVTLAVEKPCGDWAPYQTAKCFKVFVAIVQQNFTDAQATCSAHDSGKLVSITTKDEQDFLVNYLFKEQQIVDPLWLGAKLSASDHVYHWEDGSQLSFTNWASGRQVKNLPDHCLQMNTEGEEAGKWVESPCKKKNLVVCQKAQTSEGNSSLPEIKELLSQLEKDRAQDKQQFSEELSQLRKALLTAEQTQQQFQMELAKLQANISTSQKTSSLPIGFIYIQLPRDKTPAELWPTLTWSDISALYENVFFRVTGGQTESFGVVQGENAPTIDSIESQGCIFESPGRCHDNAGKVFPFSPSITLPRTAGWSDYFWSKKHADGPYTTLYRFRSSGGEVRPKNMAIKVWKRTA